MDHGVAIGADGTEIPNGINFIAVANFGYRDQMVDMNVTGSEIPIELIKQQAADGSGKAIMA